MKCVQMGANKFRSKAGSDGMHLEKDGLRRVGSSQKKEDGP